MSGESNSISARGYAPAGNIKANPSPQADRFAWLATFLARRTLRFSNYPGRSLIGWHWRREGRRRSGHFRGRGRFTVRTADGLTLDAWYSPATDRPGTPRRLPVVMLHGWIEVKECHFHRARQLNRRGHDVVLFDHRAHGRSGGRAATFGVREREDLRAVIDEAIRQGYIGERVITLGYSMGAATALQHAPDDPRVAAVVALAPFSDFRTAVDSFRHLLAPWMNKPWLLAGFDRATREEGFGFDEASTLDAINRISVPILLVEGGCDANLPPDDHTRRLIEAKTQGPLTVLRLDKANHMSLCRRPWLELNRALHAFCGAVG